MPIGFDPGDRPRTPAPPGPPSSRPPAPAPSRPPSAPAPAPPSTASPGVREDETPDIEVVVWTVWRTAADERVCPVCGPLDGGEWPADAGPQPPAHPNCRCARVFSRVELRVRG